MTNTERSFSDKWRENPSLVFDETLREGSEILNWILARNGLSGLEGLRKHLSERKRILDAGCGNGRITALLRNYSTPARTEIVGIDLVAADVAKANLANYENVVILSRDLLDNLRALGTFDFIYCQEVLHHTADPKGAFLNLCSLLADGGEIAIYVYKKKAPIREFVDDFVRARIADLPYQEAMKVAAQITALGKSLAELSVSVRVPNVDILQIEAGEYDIQRLIYHFFMKCFWNPDLTEHENAVINYDWYHPHHCSRHTIEEVSAWFAEADLQIIWRYQDMYGITMRGINHS